VTTAITVTKIYVTNSNYLLGTIKDACSSGVCKGVDVYCQGVCGDGIVAQAEQW
jgi:hypothetical protein